MEHEGNSDISSKWCTWKDPQRLSKRSRGVEKIEDDRRPCKQQHC